MKRVAFLSGPYRATAEKTVLDHIRQAEQYAIALWREGYAVICPHLNTAHFDGLCPDSMWLEGDLEILSRLRTTDLIFMIPGWERSEGSKAEKKRAEELGIPIFYSLEELKGCLSTQ